MTKEIKTTTISFEDFSSIDFEPPASWYVRIATGDYIFYHVRDRVAAQSACDNDWGKGKYKVVPTKPNKAPKGELTAKGWATTRGQKR